MASCRKPFAFLAAGLPGIALSAQDSALNPASGLAQLIADLWWSMFAGAAAITTVVLALLLFGILRGRGRQPRPLGEKGSRRLVLGGGVVIPVFVLLALVTSSVMVGRQVLSDPGEGALTIEVVGKRWWWEIHYLDASGNRVFTTANEIHVPVGRPVRFLVTSDNVIHSFWAPSLQGKMDMIPGQINTISFEARKPGVYKGHCAEFCGEQHAKMKFQIIAEPEPAYQAWFERERQPARPVADPLLVQGRQAFVAHCARCHAIRGVPEGPLKEPSEWAPDLTHVGSRRTLAAAIIPNTAGHLGGWIADPQSIKPQSLMPPTALAPEELRALVHYLQSLK